MDVGLYGKLPSHGDFLRRRTSDGFVSTWDAWLQQCMSASRSALGDRWLDVYLTSPAWRFSAAAGACGAAPLAGLMVPSVDRVGRYFPLTIVAELPSHVSPVAAAAGAPRFYERAERLVIDTLEADRVDFESFDEHVARLAEELSALSLRPSVLLTEGASILSIEPGAHGCRVPIGSPAQLSSVFEQLLAACLSTEYAPLMVWWTDGSSIVEPSCVISTGLPHPDAFAAFLEGSWSEYRWHSLVAQVTAAPEDVSAVLDTPLRLRSAAASDVGKVRAINEDSFIEHPESGLWAVADGLGGHSDGEIASHMVCDALAGFQQAGTFEDTIRAACDRLGAVNDQLVRTAARLQPGNRSGSTVVALLVRGSRCAVLWAGDSRLYRWRSGRLEQLTRDHSAPLPGAPGRGNPDAITRAVGAQAHLELDVCREQVRPGDRYLLCTDGLTRAVPEARMRAAMEVDDVAAAARALVDATLEVGAPDNVTALVVEARGDTSAQPR